MAGITPLHWAAALGRTLMAGHLLVRRNRPDSETRALDGGALGGRWRPAGSVLGSAVVRTVACA